MNTYEMKGRRFMRPVLTMLAVMVMAWPLGSYAAQIEGISLTPSANGDMVSIQADTPLTYKVFDLEAPSRVVLIMPGASLKSGVEPLRSEEKAGVKSVFPTASKDGVRIEIGLDRPLKYDVVEQGKKLLLQFASPAKPAAGQGSSSVLEDLSVHDRDGVTELVLRGQHMNASHDAFVTNHGRTMILDLWGATSKLTKEHYAVSTQKISDVTVGQAQGRVRLVVSLLPGEKENHQIDATAHEMVVRFGNIAPHRKQGVVKVEDVHFQPDDRVAHLVIRTDVTNPIVNLHQQGSNVVMDIRKAVLAAGQQRSQDVSEFPGPIKQVDAYKVDDQVRIVARLRDKVEVSSFQQGNVLTVTFKPKKLAMAEKGAAGGETVYTGQKVSFDFKDIDIRNALKLIAEMSNLNIIMSDDVSGKLTMRLVNVPWDQALDIILSARGLGKELQGNVMRIAPIKVLADERQSRLQAMKGSEQLEPLITEVIPLNYASVKDIKKMLSQSGSSSASAGAASSTQASAGKGASSGQGAGISLLSSRGTFLADERTNTLIVKDTQESVNNIKRLITTLDKPVKQVLIEARIVEAQDNFTRDLGVRWGGNFSSNSPNISGGGIQGSTNPLDNSTPNVATGSQGYLVDLPAATGAGAGGAIGLNFGYLQGLINLNLELSAAEADGKIKIVSNPRVVTTNLQAATINQGSDIPFTNSTSTTSGTTVTFKKATLGLTVTPQISSDNRIMLHVLATKDSPSNSSVAGNPIIDTKQIDTNILLSNGETVVIGGIYTRDQEDTSNGVPGLSKIPVLGWLFKNNSKIDKKTELLIFITPTILKTGPASGSDVAQTP